MKNALYKSVALHLVVLILFLVDVPVFWRRNMTIEQVPIIVDLNNVKISEMTRLKRTIPKTSLTNGRK